MNNDFKIRIFQPIVPEYRVALFDGVGTRYGDRAEVWASEGAGQDRSCPLREVRYDYAHQMKKIGPFVWQKGFSLCGLRRGDVVVVCGDVHQLSSLWIAFKAKLKGIAVVWWGHHRTATSRDMAVRVRLAVAKMLCDVFLAYTRTGIKYLESVGFKHGRVFATGNTIDQQPVESAIEAWTSERLRTFQAENNIVGKKLLLCCSVLRPKVMLELAIKALAAPELSGVLLAVIGDGDEKVAYQELAADLGVASRIRWIGATRDQMEMAPWFLSASAFVYPGSIGLSILHSFSYALPVVTHGNVGHQMPEFEVMEDGKTGLCFKENDVDDLKLKVAQILSDEDRRLKMSRYCRQVAHERYSMKAMIDNYCEAIECAHNLLTR